MSSKSFTTAEQLTSKEHSIIVQPLSTDMAPCKICNDLLPNRNTYGDYLELELEFQSNDLKSSAERGCPSCSMLLDGYSPFNTKQENHVLSISSSRRNGAPTGIVLRGSNVLQFNALKGDDWFF